MDRKNGQCVFPKPLYAFLAAFGPIALGDQEP
jgi:hypothetical protein